MNDRTAASRTEVTLEDKYVVREGWLYMTGNQALVRIPLQQRMRDEAAGLNTAGYISGYRGSPLGRYDMDLWSAGKHLQSKGIVFRSGLNEDLAATAIWGSQYVGVWPGAKVDGVFGIWYGKGPGVDRSGDALRHANLAGTSPLGGVIALAGDDHGAKSSTVANFSDTMFVAVGIPVLYPSNTQELLDYGLHGIAMSRYSGCWVGMKVVTDVVEGGGSVHVAPDEPRIRVPTGVDLPEGGMSTRKIDLPLQQEDRLYHHKLRAALDYARLNELNRIIFGTSDARLGIVSAGKAYQDVLQAMANLGLDATRIEALGVRLLKIGMTWPLDPEIVREFADGLSTIVIVEEKRPLLEDQIRSILYGSANPHRIIGKRDGAYGFDKDAGQAAFPNAGELDPMIVARVVGQAIATTMPDCTLAACVGEDANEAPRPSGAAVRKPSFCSGCPHNRSTQVIEGSRALAGIGCHSMAWLVDPLKTTTFSHMGAEGVMWLGQQPFTTEKHVFANLGDGTYAHSGFLAVRQAIAAHVPITYKILFNGFVSMTGGQRAEGEISVSAMLTELAAEGVKKLALVSDDPIKHADLRLPAGTQLLHRSEMERIQREFREYPDVSVIIYEQPCATERRRLRKRGKWEDPKRRAFINSAVCEGCGDCGKASNCMSVEPLETALGRKRRINQSSCNKDFSCVEGFCPSFVTVVGGDLRKGSGVTAEKVDPHVLAAQVKLPAPTLPDINHSFGILIAGIGGTGVVTVGQTVAMAAHVDGLFTSNLDITGLAQKYGAVLSHVRLARSADSLHATRMAAGEADTLIGCDLVVAAGDDAIVKLRPATSSGAVCVDVVPTSDFSRNPDLQLDGEAMVGRLQATLDSRAVFFEGLRLATELTGDSIAANMLALGAAWQRGQIPISLAALERAMELNGVAVEMNKEAFLWGRLIGHDLAAVERVSGSKGRQVIEFVRRKKESLEDVITHRIALLTAYQNAAYAARFARLVERVRQAESALAGSQGVRGALTEAVARSYYKLLAAKDEYEVARLYTDPAFLKELRATFGGDFSLRFHVGAWPFAPRPRGASERLHKREVGPWLMVAFKLLARVRFLRGSVADPFRFSEERRLNAQLLANYEADIEQVLASVAECDLATALKLASWPEKVRGYGHVRQQHSDAISAEREQLLTEIGSPATVRAFVADSTSRELEAG